MNKVTIFSKSMGRNRAMAKNPMQRKAQNSFLLGMLITLLITGIIIAFLILQLTKLTKDQKKAELLYLQMF